MSTKQGTVFSWQDARQQARQLSEKIAARRDGLPDWAPKPLSDLASEGAASLGRLELELGDVARTEEQIQGSLNCLETEAFETADQGLSAIERSLGPGLPELLRPDIELWSAAAVATAELSRVANGLPNLLSLEPDAETGLLPEVSPIESLDALSPIREAASRAEGLVAQANSQSKFRRRVPWPAQVRASAESALEHAKLLKAYRERTERLRAIIREGKWSEANEARQFDPGNFVDGYMRLLNALDIAAAAATFPASKNRLKFLRKMDLSHPFLASLERERARLEAQEGEQRSQLFEAARLLCSKPRQPATLAELLKTPLAADPESLPAFRETLKRSKETATPENVLGAAGRNRGALLALAGDVNSVASELRTSSDYIPHNLAVAAAAYVRRERRAPSLMDAAIGACALLRDSEAYRGALAAAMRMAMPDASGMETELERLFSEAGLDWGGNDDPKSPALRFHIELGAIRDMRGSPAASSLPHPMGPALVEFYGLHERLSLVLKSSPSGLRRWYGPLAAAEALLRNGYSPEAQSALAEVAENAAAAACCPAYSGLPNPALAIQEDVRELEVACTLYELRRIRVPIGSAPEDLASTVGRLCAALLERGAKPEEIAREVDRIFGELLEAEGVERMETAYRTMTQLLEMGKSTSLQVYERFLRKKRSDMALKLIVAKPDAAPKGIKSIIPELVTLAEAAFQDDPNDPTACVMRRAVLMLQAKQAGAAEVQAQRPFVQLLHAQALREKWPFKSINMIKDLLDVLDGTREEDRWLRDLARNSFKQRGAE